MTLIPLGLSSITLLAHLNSSIPCICISTKQCANVSPGLIWGYGCVSNPVSENSTDVVLPLLSRTLEFCRGAN